jgi:outer membrane protein
MRRFGPFLLCAGLSAPSVARAQSARPTSLAEAVAIALEQNPDARTSELEVKGARASRAESAGGFGPKLHVDASLQQWNSPFDLPFAFPGQPPPPPVFRVRDAFTWSASVSLIQPLTQLWAIYDDYKVQDLGVDVAAIKRQVARREIAFHAVESYYRLLEAARLSEVADASVAQLESQEKQAQSLFANGVIGKSDLLRAGLALASAQERAIQMRGQTEIARGQLDVALGLPQEAAIEPAPFQGDPPAASDATLQAAEARASAQRLELKELDRGIAQANAGAHFAKKKLLPAINAVGNYTHFDGSAFQQANAAYVGLFASWDVWDWGTTLGGIAGAETRLEQARVARKKAEDQVRLEARQAFVTAETAQAALAVARTSVSQAEESYRIVTKRFENNAATSFDVVDAEAQLTQARGQVESALYDLLIARAALDRATGAPLPGQR